MNNNNYINKKIESNFMKKILLILILFMMMFVPSFAQNDQLIYYRFEMGVGGIALDSSGNGNNGVLNGAIYDTKLNRLNTGSYSIKFNAAQSVITTITKFWKFQSFNVWELV